MLAKLFVSLCLIGSVFAADGITEADAYRTNSQYQWDVAMDGLASIHFESEDEVLDVGCGDGKISAWIGDRVRAVVGVDISEEMIALARSRHEDSRLTFVQTSATEIAFKEHFDKAVSFNAFHWVVEQRQALRSIFDSLKKGGTVFIQMPAPCENNIGLLAQKMARTEKWGPYFPDYRPVRVYFTPEEYRALLNEVGFEVESVSKIDAPLHFPNRDALIAWLTPLINFVDHLPEDLQRQFIDEFADELLRIDPPAPDGKISIHSAQLRAMGKKPILEPIGCGKTEQDI
ncbi:MAG TPA: methyltransferase domain-containing protein [Chlamydiales bacterium]|nr:methyltransferase domain-containing protein [Chlamydiales bacterium]